MSNAKTFRALLGERGLTPTQGAERLGVSRRTIHHWLKHGIPQSRVGQVSERLGIAEPRLRYGDDAATHLLDDELLLSVVEAIHLELDALDLDLPPKKLGELTRIVYRHCAARGQVDRRTIQEMVRLAA